jgi:hypothetical protein
MTKSNVIQFPSKRRDKDKELVLTGSDTGLVLREKDPNYKGYTYEPSRIQMMIDFIKMTQESKRRSNKDE